MLPKTSHFETYNIFDKNITKIFHSRTRMTGMVSQSNDVNYSLAKNFGINPFKRIKHTENP